MAGKRGEPPDDRHFVHYAELHASNSVDEAVMRAEKWAREVLARRTTPRAPAYPEAGWFADQIVAELHSMRYYLRQSEGQAHKAVWYALRLGEVVAEARLQGHLDDPPGGPPPGPIPPSADAPPTQSP